MDGKVLIDSIVCMKGEQLRVTYALFNEANLLHAFLASLRKTITRNEKDALKATLKNILNRLEDRTDAQLQLELLESMSQCVQVIPRRSFVSPDSLFEEGNDIVFKVLEIAREQDKTFKGVTLDEFMHHQVDAFFEKMDAEFQRNPDVVTANLLEAIPHLPPEMIQEIKTSLKIDEFSSEVLRRVMSTGGSALLFSGAVEVAGFSFYTTASTLLAWMSGLFGVTLPFSAYIGLSTSIAFLSGPIFLAILAAMGGVYVWYGNSTHQKRLLPGLVTQIILCRNANDPVNYEPLIEQWKHVSHQYRSLAETQRTLVFDQEQIQNQIKSLSTRLSEIKTRKSQVGKLKSEIRTQLKQLLSTERSFDIWKINDAFSLQATELSDCRSATANLRSIIEGKTERVVDSVLNSINISILGTKIMYNQRKENDILDRMVVSLLETATLEDCVLDSPHYATYIQMHGEYHDLHREEMLMIDEEKESKDKLALLEQEYSSTEADKRKHLDELKKLMKRFPRLQYCS
ncbi:hypothetical protein [Alicyclobacillus mali (ex Roth et al. 2021)]|uniref:hypothetical protein n=1 Tax=Alicyclobacillus mali (ex Roth et al. 2021) TaxID=1123961 RepID=UPI001A8FB40D|nr:hypothetical protein [Alicyclobacillus mali (ex Roth et al. 2021)]